MIRQLTQHLGQIHFATARHGILHPALGFGAACALKE
jgi:hypothetical protein